MTFSDFSLAEQLVRATRRAGFDSPTPIQCDAIPPIRDGRDVLASAQTGSGKTAAFLLPIMDRLLPQQRGATRALVIAPTRELAAQISDHFRLLADGTGLRATAVHGGVGMGSQERAFRKGVDLIAATPGRLLDHFSRSYAGLEDLRFLVLDEADRMLDMGFLPDIRRILERIPRERQTLLFSATMPEPIVALSRELLRNPVRLNIGRPPGPAPRITHSVYPVSTERKQGLFLELLGQTITGSVLVFTRTKHRANRLADFLDTNGVACARIHGNRSQSQRNAALAGFRQGRFKVLVATDIAARGIDVEALGSVVNFDVPHVPEDYIHRVGRTARAQASGSAFSLVSPDEEKDLRAIEKHIGSRLPRQNLDGFDYSAPKGEAPKAAPRPAAPRPAARTTQARPDHAQPRPDRAQPRPERAQSRGRVPAQSRGRGGAPAAGRRRGQARGAPRR
jgi:ATP-dependent RNA helicase RhlE